MKPAAALIGPMMLSISQGTGNDHMDALHRYRAEKIKFLPPCEAGGNTP